MSAASYEIRMLQAGEVDAYVAHRAIHDVESATETGLPTGPYSRTRVQDPAAVRALALARWSTALTEPGWRRAWGLWLSGAVVGVVDLAGGQLPTESHRATLGVGIEQTHRGRGWGRRLVETAIGWARQEPAISWVDLGVFEGNDRAVALYRKLGFVECGRVPDRFRVDGTSITDIHMTLRVDG